MRNNYGISTTKIPITENHYLAHARKHVLFNAVPVK